MFCEFVGLQKKEEKPTEFQQNVFAFSLMCRILLFRFDFFNSLFPLREVIFVIVDYFCFYLF
eukprot:TRINITY_DN14328_c0_g1_i1.p1 TRINITY_DN14328_c0_g1~~TRINITY_DN14328_c0_g1_i1.p1  ORF type:complete len:62 (+),score=6.69 TRINITY_DN14328_c0_g1_i1:249-434(+)